MGKFRPMRDTTECRIVDLGTVPYDGTLALQERLVNERLAQPGPDTLLLLEHRPVITLGRGGKREHLLVDEGELALRQVDLRESPRGGDITCHAPGQIVAYPIVHLPPPRQDVRKYVGGLEEVVIRTLEEFGVHGARCEGQRGVWIGNDKVAAVGVRITRWVTSHGLALNVCNDLSLFNLIVPCGLSGRGVTSLERLLDRPITVAEVKPVLVAHFVDVFGWNAHHEAPPPSWGVAAS